MLNALAVLYKYQARFAEAARLYRRALAIIEKELGPDHVDLATLYHNLGGLEHARGRYARRAVCPAFGRDSPAGVRRESSGCRRGRGRVSSHPRRPREVRGIRAAVPAGVGDLSTGLRSGPLRGRGEPEQSGRRTVCPGRGAQAERLYHRALAIKEQVLGSQHPDVAMTLNNLAVLYVSLGR